MSASHYLMALLDNCVLSQQLDGWLQHDQTLLVSQARPNQACETTDPSSLCEGCGLQDYTAKSYVLNQNWNQSDPDLYPETQPNSLAMSLIRFVLVLQFCISSTETVLRHAIRTGLIQICAYWSWYCPDATAVLPVTEFFGNRTVLGQNIFGCVSASVTSEILYSKDSKLPTCDNKNP